MGNSNRNTTTSEPQGSTPAPADQTPTQDASLNTAPDNVAKNDVQAAALEAKQRELKAQEEELARRSAELQQRERELREEASDRDRMWSAAQDRLRAQSVTAAGPLGAAVPGELMSTATPFTTERTHWDELAVDPLAARNATKQAIADRALVPDRKQIARTQDFETIGKVKTATGYVPARTRIPAGSRPVDVILREWERGVIRPFEAPPPPPPPNRSAAPALEAGRPNPNR